jgi:hypothetical protein
VLKQARLTKKSITCFHSYVESRKKRKRHHETRRGGYLSRERPGEGETQEGNMGENVTKECFVHV